MSVNISSLALKQGVDEITLISIGGFNRPIV